MEEFLSETYTNEFRVLATGGRTFKIKTDWVTGETRTCPADKFEVRQLENEKIRYASMLFGDSLAI